jgi:tetratricopeptide (TPR) repeat protein
VQILEGEGDSKDALIWYKKVGGSNLLDAQVRIARIFAGRGEVSRAREIIQQLRSRMGRDSIQLDLMEGEILSELKHYRAAIDVFTRALEEHPDNPELLYARAMVAVNIDRIDMLEQDLQRILERDPDHADALNALGYTLADRTDRYQEALGYIEQALRLKPDSPAVLDSMGWVQYRLGNNREALRYLWRAMEIMPDAEIAAHVGEVLWQQGERKRARQVWDEALLKKPDNEYLLRVLERYK